MRKGVCLMLVVLIVAVAAAQDLWHDESTRPSADDYLAEVATRPAGERDEEPEQAAQAVAADLERAYTPERLSLLATNGGVE